jgi:hypothetical protein
MRTRRLRTLSLVALLAPAACTESVPAPVLAPPEPGLAVEPSWLTFTCVRPGCDTKLAATVKVVGDRDLAVKRVVLSDRDRTDITLQAGRQPPFILKASETFAVEVSYKPTGDPRLGDVEVLVTYTDASASEEDDRVKAGELKIPLVRRLVGEPTLQVSPEVLDFGPVLPGARKTLPLTISNVGFGNVGLVLESIRSDLVDVSVSNMPSVAILPMDTWNVDVTFRAAGRGVHGGLAHRALGRPGRAHAGGAGGGHVHPARQHPGGASARRGLRRGAAHDERHRAHDHHQPGRRGPPAVGGWRSSTRRRRPRWTCACRAWR